MFLALAQAEQQVDGTAKPKIPNSIDNLKASDPFVKAAAQLPIEPGLKYHSIIAQRKPELPLEKSDDGLVPYWSAHLDGAVSEKVIISGHSVQETPGAIMELPPEPPTPSMPCTSPAARRSRTSAHSASPMATLPHAWRCRPSTAARGSTTWPWR